MVNWICWNFKVKYQEKFSLNFDYFQSQINTKNKPDIVLRFCFNTSGGTMGGGASGGNCHPHILFCPPPQIFLKTQRVNKLKLWYRNVFKFFLFLVRFEDNKYTKAIKIRPCKYTISNMLTVIFQVSSF